MAVGGAELAERRGGDLHRSRLEAAVGSLVGEEAEVVDQRRVVGIDALGDQPTHQLRHPALHVLVAAVVGHAHRREEVDELRRRVPARPPPTRLADADGLPHLAELLVDLVDQLLDVRLVPVVERGAG